MSGQFGDAEIEPLTKQRRAHTLRRIAEFFRPYRLAGRWSCWSRSSSPACSGIINPYLLKLLIDEAIPQQDLGLLNLYVGLMIVVPHHQRASSASARRTSTTSSASA